MRKEIDEIKDDPVYDELSLLTKMKDQSFLDLRAYDELNEVFPPAKVLKRTQKQQSEFV